MVSLQLVENMEQVKQNLIQYDFELRKNKMTLNTKGVQQWYYIYKLELFGPSRYIGYADVTIEKHKNADYLDGGITTQKLKKWFDKCDDTILFDKITEKLIDYLSRFDMNIRRDSNGDPSFKLNLLKEEIPQLKEIYLKENISPSQDYSDQVLSLLSPEKIKFQALLKSKGNETNIETNFYNLSTTIYNRDPYIAQYVKNLASGKCQLCELSAPFHDKLGNPFLECHHIDWLSKGGKDTVQNCVALCSNCHRKMHILDLPEDVKKLKLISSNYVID